MSNSAVPDFSAPKAPTRVRVRLWPAVVIVLLEWFIVRLSSFVPLESAFVLMVMFLGPMVVPPLFAAWWLLFSRVPWRDRFLVLAVCVLFGGITYVVADQTIGFVPILYYGIPLVMTAWVAWLVVSIFMAWSTRRALLTLVMATAWGYLCLLRFDGLTGSFQAQISWRWAPTAEQLFLADRTKPNTEQLAGTSEELKLQPGDWPGFRGPNRDAKLTGVRLVIDWNAHPPKELWRKRVGPGWGSFAVVDHRAYTQEQRGDFEVVVCYDANTGDEIWVHQDKTRFNEAMAGPGPRATPTFDNGKLYVVGANGALNCLDAATGKPVWSRNIVKDADLEKAPEWGFAASPFVYKGLVTVFGGGKEGKSVLAYQATTGDVAWSAGDGKLSYCSTQLATLGGVTQLLLTSDLGLTAFDPEKGTVLWQHKWPMDNMARVTQPAVLDDAKILIGSGFGFGTRMINAGTPENKWESQPVWTTTTIKPYYNDLVVHQKHFYGFDNNFFTCVSLEDGKSKWRVRGYGSGQVLLLVDQGLLLILAESGEVALLEATPEAHRVLGKFQAIKGKTWNHPVIANGKLFVRNGEEMACYELAVEK